MAVKQTDLLFKMAISCILVLYVLEFAATDSNFKGLKFQYNPRSAPILANPGLMKNAIDIAAQTLVDEYNGKSSVVTKKQELGILDLSRQLNGPGFSNLESDIMSASSMIASKSNGQSKEQPPEDETDDEEEDTSETESFDELIQSTDAPEKSLLSISSRIISMGKSLLKALRTLTGAVSGAVSEPIRITVTKVIRDRKISVCSKMSLDALVKENEKLDLITKGDDGCNIGSALGYNLSTLHVAISLLKCYVQASSDKRSSEMLSFNSQIVSILTQLGAIQKLNRLNQYTNDQAEIFNQFLELQAKLEALNYNGLLVGLSDTDVSLQTFNLALFALMRNIFSLLQVSPDTNFKDNKEFNEVYCQAGDIMVNEFRRLGTTTVERLISTARTVVNSFDNLATKSINILDKMSTYKEMYDQIFITAKALQDGMNAYKS